VKASQQKLASVTTGTHNSSRIPSNSTKSRANERGLVRLEKFSTSNLKRKSLLSPKVVEAGTGKYLPTTTMGFTNAIRNKHKDACLGFSPSEVGSRARRRNFRSFLPSEEE